MKNNAFFEHLEEIGREWQKRRDAHKALKDQIIAEHGWDSPELKAWYAEEEQIPFSSGASKAFRAWKYSPCDDELVMEDHLWDSEVHDFIETLREAGLRTFVTTNQSTALMGNLHAFAAEGCTMLGLCTITKKSRWDEDEQLLGIRFSL